MHGFAKTLLLHYMLLQALALLNVASGDDASKAGLALGTASCAVLLAMYIKRTLDTGAVVCHVNTS